MTRPRLFGLIVATVLLSCLGVHLAGPHEPRYAGKRLTRWLEDYQLKIRQGKFGPDGDDWDKDGPIEFAVRGIGTNGIPTMIQLLRADDSKAKSLFFDLLDKQPVVHLPFKRDYEKHGMAWLGFSLLGTNAVSACNDLANFAASANESARMSALYSLEYIQPPREILISALLNFLHDSNPYTQYIAGEELDRVAPEEARKAGVYQMLPELKASDADQAQPSKTQQDAAPNSASAEAPPASVR